MRSPPGWWTSTTCSSGPSCWAAASSSSPTGSGFSSNCWTSAGSATAWCTCATAPRHEQRQRPLHRRGPGRGARTEPSLGDGDDQGDQGAPASSQVDQSMRRAGREACSAFRSVVSMLLRELGDFSLYPQGRPCVRPPAAAVLGPPPLLRLLGLAGIPD